MFTFFSVIREKFEYNLRIIANFSVKTQKSADFAYTFSKNYIFFGGGGGGFFFFNKDHSFFTKNLFFTTKDAKNFVKISGLVTCLHF